MEHKEHTTLMTGLFLLILMLVSAKGWCAEKILPVPVKVQEHSNWCWNGCSQALLAYSGITVSQGQIANFVAPLAGWQDASGVTPDCAGTFPDEIDDPITGQKVLHPCNQADAMYSGETSDYGDIEDILFTWGITVSGFAAPLLKEYVISEIEAERPFVIRFGWKDSNDQIPQDSPGHVVVAHGYDEGDDGLLYIDYMDPLPGKGYTRSDYDWVKNRYADQTWTHTLQTSRSASASASAPDIRYAWLRILSNDPDEATLHFDLLGQGVNEKE
jgi:hypothetical protein